MKMLPKIESATILEGCDPAVASGIDAFMCACTTSYTTLSKTYSIWTLIRQHVEPSLSNYLRKRGRLSYEVRFGRNELADAMKCDMGRLEDFGLADAMKRDMGRLEDLLRFYIRPSRLTKWDETFQATLESVLYLGFFCKGRMPNRSVGKGAERGAAQKPVRQVFDGRQYPFCELCWRHCQHEDQNDPRLEGVRRSKRFCIEHDPGKPKSRYRVDHCYREQFHEKLTEIYREFPRQRDKWITLEGDFDEASIRRYAYEFVHARPVDNRLKVTQLLNAGHTNVEIAKMLGMSRQMVHKILNNPLKSAFGRTNQGAIIHLRESQGTENLRPTVQM